ncbi:MAG: M48 family metallopeptidase [Pseudomonadota bacterium]
MPDRRWRAAAVIAAVAGLSACGTDDTGLGLDLVPEQQVQQMGLETWQAIRAETPAVDDTAQQQRARRVADKVLRAAGKEPSEWEVVVFQGAEPNAFALPGKKIGVYEGMMRLADTDAQLAAVISHEIAHNEADHSAERLNSQVASQAGVDIAASVLGAATGMPADLTAGILGAGVQYGVLLPYSRNQELEADRLGLGYMAEAGYDPRGAVALWEKMSQAGGQPPAFLSTHPAPRQRIEELQAMLPEAMEAYRRSGAG